MVKICVDVPSPTFHVTQYVEWLEEHVGPCNKELTSIGVGWHGENWWFNWKDTWGPSVEVELPDEETASMFALVWS